jgi:HAD superfamily hydrolase (TIGR01509 family)
MRNQNNQILSEVTERLAPPPSPTEESAGERSSHTGHQRDIPSLEPMPAPMHQLAQEFLATPPQPRITSPQLRRNFPVITFLETAEEKVVISSRFKGIAIDFDGTIMKFNFTEGMRQAAFALAMDSIAMEATGQPLPRQERIRIHREAIDHPEKKMSAIIAEHLSPIIGHRLTEKQVMSRWKQYCETLLLTSPERYGRPPRTAINRGIIPLLEGAQRLGKTAGVCTAGDHDFVMPLIRAGHLDHFFDYDKCVFTSLHPEIHTKPHADPYLLIARKMGITPSELLVLEDSATGALAGLRAGAQVILQPSGDREKTLLKLAQAIQHHHATWIRERPNAIIVLTEGAGFTQLVHEDA